MKKLYFAIVLFFPVFVICQQKQPADFALTWKISLGKPIVSSPVVNEGVVYAGSLDSNLYALDEKSGAIKWKFRTQGQIRSTVSINGNIIYLTSGDGNLYAVIKSTGKLKWVFKSGGDEQYDPYDYFMASPLLYNNTVYFGMGDSTFYALSMNDGKLVWKYKTTGMIHSTPAVGKGRIYVASFDGYVYALSAENGQLVWKFKSVGHDYFPKGEMQFPPTYANGLVYIGGRDYNLYALDADKGYCHWNREFPGGWATTITLSPKNDSDIIVGTSDPEVILCLDGITGKEIWKTNISSNVFGNFTFTPRGHTLIAGTAIGELYEVKTLDGKIERTFYTDAYKANRLHYLKEDDSYRDDIGNLVKTGDDYITFCNSLGAILSTPATEDKYIIITSMDGNVYCLSWSA